MIGFYIMGTLSILWMRSTEFKNLKNKHEQILEENKQLKETVIEISATLEHISKEIAIEALSAIIEEIQKSMSKKEEAT